MKLNVKNVIFFLKCEKIMCIDSSHKPASPRPSPCRCFAYISQLKDVKNPLKTGSDRSQQQQQGSFYLCVSVEVVLLFGELDQSGDISVFYYTSYLQHGLCRDAKYEN